MNYRLGLDMGTDSLGWSVIELSEDKSPVDVIDMGVRIFDGGRNPKTYESLAVARRIARGMRRKT
jgi:CRISPR-associated endonuclease Csn1